MNIVGKILVILNLILAFVIVGFMAVTFTTRDNWKKYTENFKRELDISGSNALFLQKTTAELKQKRQTTGPATKAFGTRSRKRNGNWPSSRPGRRASRR